MNLLLVVRSALLVAPLIATAQVIRVEVDSRMGQDADHPIQFSRTEMSF